MRCARAATLRLRTLRFNVWLSANRAGVIVAGLLVGMMAIAAPTAIAVSPHGDGGWSICTRLLGRRLGVSRLHSHSLRA